jgi:hypothetical protein
MKDNKDYDLECAMSDIRRVESLKVMKPEVYNKAIDMLKKESSAIDSLEKLKDVAKEKMEEEEPKDESDDE